MNKVRYFIPATLFYLFIFILSSQNTDIGFAHRGLDKIAHFVEFSLLGLFLSLGYFKAFNFSASIKSALVFLSGLPLGILDELHQSFVPGRTSALGDIIADAGGIVFGIMAYRYLDKRRRRNPGNRTA